MSDTLTRTIRQYSRTMSINDMDKLWEIARGYTAVKEYVYKRYAGVKSLPKLYPGYTVQNEMTKSGLRSQLMLPSIYFYLAIFEALGDIKAGWKLVRRKIVKNVSKNEGFDDLEKYYIRYVLKSDKQFQQVVNRQMFAPTNQFLQLEGKTKRLNNYICRQVRKYKLKHHSNKTNVFSISPKGYAYENGGISITTKTPRKRLFVPLTDKNKYDRQITIELKENRLVIYVPVESRVHRHADYVNEIGAVFGYYTMLTTSTGNIYGEQYGEIQGNETERLIEINAKHQRMLVLYNKHLSCGSIEKAKNIEKNNLGRQKYNSQKAKADAKIKAYINAKINCLIKEEKPAVIFIPKLPAHGKSYSKAFNAKLAGWRRGYIKERLAYKCNINHVKLIEVNAAGISKECSDCGAVRSDSESIFRCLGCGKVENSKINAAKLVLTRGQQQKNNLYL